MPRLGLADALGIVVSLVALAWLPGAADPLTNIKLLFLVAGGLAVSPALIVRWMALGRPGWAVGVPVGAAISLVPWGLVSTVASGAPMWNSIFGWWGRGDGLLAWLGALCLLLGGACLTTREVGRTVTWILGGASIAAFIGLLQAAGVGVPEGNPAGVVTATMGNTNFAAGYFAITASLALGRALTNAALWQRIWGGILFMVLTTAAVLTGAVQGPAALAAGVVALGTSYALLYRGRFRQSGLFAAGMIVVLGAAATAGSFFRAGPIANLWSDRTFDIRQQYWQSAINIMNGVPLFGTGPDGFARFVAEYRPESYVALLGPTLRVSAAHNVALQFGAVLGYVGLILWLVVFVGTGVVLLMRIVQRPVASIALTSSVMGALTAYFIQGMVSIDMLPLLAVGWLVAGLALACGHEPLPPPAAQASDSSPKASRTRGPRKSSGLPQSTSSRATKAAWAPVVGSLLALSSAILVGSQMSTVNQIQSVSTREQALDFLANPMVPCVLRVEMSQQVLQLLPPGDSFPAVVGATELDNRCSPMINFASDALVQQANWVQADRYTRQGLVLDPLLDLSWALRSRYLLGIGDLAGAEKAAEEVARLQAMYPPDQVNPSVLETLRADIAAAQAELG